jgi:hypothetical protein
MHMAHTPRTLEGRRREHGGDTGCAHGGSQGDEDKGSSCSHGLTWGLGS